MIGMIIADDELIIRQGLCSIMWSDFGIELKGLAANGLEALSLIKSELPQILLTDIRMPGMDGLELINSAKSIVPEIKTILLTGYQDFEYAYKAIQLGAIGYILKPTNPDEIIQNVLKAKDMIKAEANEKLEKAKIRQQIGCMQDIVRNTVMVDRMCSKPSDSDEIRSGQVGGEDLLDCIEVVPEWSSVQNEVVRKILDYIENHYMEDITLTMIAEHIYMNNVYLSRLFKKETGENFLDILTRVRLRKACEMLSDCTLRTYEVSEKVGIKDSGYFSQVFKKYFGMTPSEYREKVISQKRF